MIRLNTVDCDGHALLFELREVVAVLARRNVDGRRRADLAETGEIVGRYGLFEPCDATVAECAFDPNRLLACVRAVRIDEQLRSVADLGPSACDPLDVTRLGMTP